MSKLSKSSASSGTRKKNARKAAVSTSGPHSPPQKSKPSTKQIKQGRAPEPKKSYIPPSKPAPVQVDPLDGMGLAALLPADLVVVLRRLAKKDGVTKTKALEELAVWVCKAKKEKAEFGMGMRQIDVLVIMLPVWLHRFPALSIHPSRRIRHLTASLHASLLEFPDLRSNILATLRETGSETDVEVSHVLGCWCLSAWDVDRGVATRGSKSWSDTVNIGIGNSESDREGGDDERLVLDGETFARNVMPFILITIMDPAVTYATIVPLPSTISGDSPASTHLGTPVRGGGASTPVGTPPGSGARRVIGGEVSAILATRIEDDSESTDDRHARLRAGAMGALRWVMDAYTPTTPLIASLKSLLSSRDFWTVLHHTAHPPFVHAQDLPSETDEGPPTVSITTEGFGAGQTVVRRVAWGLVQTLVGEQSGEGEGEGWGDHLISRDSARGLISSAILRSAFVESDPVVRSSMWDPLLVFLTKINQAWLLNMEFEHSTLSANQHIESEDDTECKSSASARETDPSLINPGTAVNLAANSPSNSRAYDEFLAFLALGCNGSPIQGYPTVLVILSTIPREILPPTLVALSGFFVALWAAIDGQALCSLAAERAKSTDAFLGAWGECLVWTIGKLVKDPSSSIAVDDVEHVVDASQPYGNMDEVSPAAVSLALVGAQFGRLVEELGKGLRVDPSVAGEKVAVILAKMEAVGRDILDGAWTPISRFARTTITGLDHGSRGEYALAFLAALHQHLALQCSSKREVEVLVAGIATEIVERCLSLAARSHEGLEQVEEFNEMLMKDGMVLERLLEHFGDVLERENRFMQPLDSLLDTKLHLLLSQPSLILSCLNQLSDATRVLSVWRHLLSTLGSSPEVDLDLRVRALGLLTDVAGRDGIRAWAKPRGGELDGLMMHVLSIALTGDPASLSVAASVLKTPGPFLSDDIVQDLISTILTNVHSHAHLLIRDPFAPLETLHASLGLLLALEQDTSAMRCPSTMLVNVMPMIFVLSFVLVQCSPREEERMVLDLAKQLWEIWRELAEEKARGTVFNTVKLLLKDLIMDIGVRPRPTAILHSFPHVDSDLDFRPILEVIPTQPELNALLSFTSSDPIDSSLAILEPLVPPWSKTPRTNRSSWNRNFDSTGLSPYARGVSALLHVFTADRQAARENMWALHHALILALFASEVLQVPGAESPVFRSNPKIAVIELREISRQAQQIAAFLLTTPDEAAWHKEVTAVLSGRTQSSRPDSMGEFVRLVFEHSRVHDTVRDSLVLHMVLQHVLRSATKEDADLWIDLARSIEDKALQTSLAISLAVTEFAPEPPKLDRYRNELASKLAGVPSNKANDIGLRLLRRLSAVAPNPESDVIFLPQQRTLYLVQTLQAWMGSDEDLNEGVEGEITRILFNLAPILQHVQGSHWEFVMDLIESQIENSSFKDTEALVILSRTLHLLTTVEDLAASNKYLRELWNQRSKVILILVRNLLASKIDCTTPSVPRAMCREQALTIIQDLPGSLMDENTLSTMCHLMTDRSVDVQKMSHQLLQQAAIRRTEHLVVEAGVDTDNTTAIELPTELVGLLQSVVNLDIEFGETNVAGQDPLAYLLGWMIAFDLFTDASLKVKTAYVDQLRKLDLIGNSLLPNVFEILSVGTEGQRPFKLDAWAVDEFWVSLYDAESSRSLRLLAAHVYYRALLTVPSLVRSWWLELKDRQLSTAVTSYTSSYFSPVLIASELSHVKPSSRAAAAARDESLADESFSVKVALAVNEVTATFNVDEQQMEIGVRLPAEYPLRAVEVRDIRRVGVRDNLWRKWLFAVQQVVTSQNGRIIDGLGLFKKNVSLHFEGQVECAICYSIICVMDRSLPTKPCKTCKNRFHASCLYKWFNTSHASSCPLCRSDIM